MSVADNWYTKMNAGIGKEIHRRAINNGENIEDDAPDMARDVLAEVCEAYMRVGDDDAITRRWQLVLLWSG